jgi:UDP-galactopyranose mutase
MHQSVIEVDYLILGAGAAGMAFADSLVTELNRTIAIVDRRVGNTQWLSRRFCQ